MIKKIKASKSEKLLFFFLITLAISATIFFFSIKNKCFFIKKIDLTKTNFKKPENIVVMNLECGKVIIELFPNISPNAVKRFKYFVEQGSYDGS
ncbi:MAG: peptidylprolyl isomerase, partial [Candidatus Pelagibacter sp.]